MMVPQVFKVTEDHILLLKRMAVSWDDCEFGAPGIDPKKPYGNSDVISDMRKILGDEKTLCPHCSTVISCCGERLKDEYYNILHMEMRHILQILVQNPSGIAPGFYDRIGVGTWKRRD